MMSKISSVSSLLAALSLVSAAPVAQQASSSSSNGGQIGIRVQLAGFDTASVINTQLDQTTVASRSQITEAQIQQSGPWCAGFSDTGATRLAVAINGNSIFDSQTPAIYSADSENTVTVASYWCANTRPEVVNFVGASGGNGGDQQQPEPINNGGNNGDNDNENGDNAATVRVQIELEAGTTFVQDNLPANVGLSAASESRFFDREIISVDVSGQGNCQFFADSNGQRALNFPGTIGSFRCTA